MSKQEEIRCRCEKLAKAKKRLAVDSADKPAGCARCVYFRPDFKYRRCQFTRCPYGKVDDVFRKIPLRRDNFSGKEVVSMRV